MRSFGKETPMKRPAQPHEVRAALRTARTRA
jgi:hypothetical protein